MKFIPMVQQMFVSQPAINPSSPAALATAQFDVSLSTHPVREFAQLQASSVRLSAIRALALENPTELATYAAIVTPLVREQLLSLYPMMAATEVTPRGLLYECKLAEKIEQLVAEERSRANTDQPVLAA